MKLQNYQVVTSHKKQQIDVQCLHQFDIIELSVIPLRAAFRKLEKIEGNIKYNDFVG